MGKLFGTYDARGSKIMNDTERTYWIDLTDLSNWSGNYTGIERVSFNLAKHYAERNDVKFFIFDKPNTGFFKVDFDIIKEPPETITEDSDIDDEIHENIVRRLAHTVPSRYKQRIPNSVNAFLKSSYRAARRVKNYRLSHKEHTRLKLVLSKQAIFTQSDVVLIFGSPWANPAMMPALIDAKLQKGFKVVQVIYDLIPGVTPYLFGGALLPEFTRYLFDVVTTTSDGLVGNLEV